MDNMKASIIIPAYNEGLRIRRTIISYIKNFKEELKDFELIIILNGCTDNTLEIVKKLHEKYPSYIVYKNYEEALGKGGAIIEGLKISKGDIIGFVDADDAFRIKGIIKLITLTKSNDCVIASKWKGKSFIEVTEPPVRKFLSRGWNFLVRTFLNLKFKDTQAGAKFFKKEVNEKIGYDFISSHFAFDAELLYKIKSNNFQIKEVYIPSKHIEGSTFKLRHSFKMFKDLLKIWKK